ncbi:selenide, water dikinase 1-like [Diaphorina citri]|uniref:Selenide, water dikinase 1-like n=1 Tax=Diaphorina citri TaxID=121845 RepID=A0A3Q0JHU7_DIACI|nr:selenide, water dikinase 1-like [Diaphorina citri]
MGAIACANVLSDIYAVGVTDIDALQMIVGISTQLTEDERDIIVPMLIEGFKAQASVAGVNISKVAVKLNPWMTIGGVVTSVCSSEEFVMPNQAQPGDVIILTKPLGTQMSVTIRSWLKNEEKLSFLKSIKVDSAMLKQCVNSAITLMATINKKGKIFILGKFA